MPFNLLVQYSNLLELAFLSKQDRDASLIRVFKRDIEDNSNFKFREKQIFPIKQEGKSTMEVLLAHLTEKEGKDEKGKKTGSRSFDMARAVRIHWIKYHIEETKKSRIEIFSYEDRVDRRDVIRTYIYDVDCKYVVILEPRRDPTSYYLITAYYLNEPGGNDQIYNKFKKKLDTVY
jgi:hypothetical protein